MRRELRLEFLQDSDCLKMAKSHPKHHLSSSSSSPSICSFDIIIFATTQATKDEKKYRQNYDIISHYKSVKNNKFLPHKLHLKKKGRTLKPIVFNIQYEHIFYLSAFQTHHCVLQLQDSGRVIGPVFFRQ